MLSIRIFTRISGFLVSEKMAGFFLKFLDLKVISRNSGLRDKVNSRRYEYILPYKTFYKFEDEEKYSKFHSF